MVSVHTECYQDMIKILKKRREELKISQRKFAEMMGVSQSYVSKVENFELKLDVIDYFNHAAALKIELSLILRTLGNHVSYYK